MWIGIAAAAVTFVLVFAIPQWLGWYDIGPPPQAKRERDPGSDHLHRDREALGRRRRRDGAAGGRGGRDAARHGAAGHPPEGPGHEGAIAKETKPAPPPAAPAAARETKPTPPAVVPAVVKETKPAPAAAAAPASPSRRTFMVQIAAFKNAKQAGQLAERVKRDGYHADVRRIESSAVPYVVRVGGYPSREQAESARDALARKGFKGFIL